MNKVATTTIQGGAEYALVPDRLKAFREANPRAKTETHPTIDGDMIIFKAYILKDKQDVNSAEATGHAYGKNTGNKAFEKLETVALGRALAQLGYLNNGQIATTEEMEEFEEFRLEKYKKAIDTAESIEDLMKIFNSMDTEEKKTFTKLLSEKKQELTNANS